MTTQPRPKCIRSMRIARELMAQGFPVIDTEPARRSPGKIVWIFASTPQLDAALTKIFEGGRENDRNTQPNRRNAAN